jgi:anti-sigma factor RsiW
MSDHDAELVALIDNELDEGSRTALLARLAADDGLRRRYQELRQTSVPLAASFGALLEQAPLARLRAALPAGEPIRPSLRRFAGIAFRELAAGLVIGALAAGIALWAASTLGLFEGREDWRTAIAEYTHLYTNKTFSPLKPDAMQQAAELKAVGAMVGANLTPENVALPDLRFTSAFMLSYGGSPRGVLAYVDPSRALRSCFASSPTARRTRLLNQRDAATCRSLGGRVTASAIW